MDKKVGETQRDEPAREATPFPDLPATFEDFVLLPADHQVTSFTEGGTAELNGFRFRIGINPVRLSLYLFTPLPHPDDASRDAVYELFSRATIQRLVYRLCKDHAVAGAVKEPRP